MQNATARVYVNDIEVGSLPADQYHQVVADVYRDYRPYLAQLWNVLVSGCMTLILLLKLVALASFALFALIAFSPSHMEMLVTAIAQATPAEIARSIQAWVSTSVIFGVIAVFSASFITGRSFGYVNQFEKRVNQRLRSLLEVPAEGALGVFIQDVAHDGK